MTGNLSLRDLQAYIKQKDFKPELKHAYFLKLIEEVGELAEVIRKERRLTSSGTIKGTIEEELYDVLYYTAALANLYEIDLEHCFHLKEELNRQKYGERPHSS
jgi:NTP pyrophosphatase (non-canonical NTP hydrolase)